ncbi:hypothetical protein [Isoptericola sp. NPDC056134]|uniref:putative phage holin n=1 Tax=Isoptericola sp. NPDC056134 TaxID=3345723 RepID=UPI0035E8DC50
MNIWREATAWFAFGGWLLFVALYSLRARWWKTPEGRNVWGVGLALTVALGIIVAAYTWPDYELRPVIVPVLYTGLGLLAVQRTVQMLRRQRQRRRESR